MPNPSTALLHKHLPTPDQAGEAIVANRTSLIVMGIILMLTGIGAIVFPLVGSLALDMVVATVFTIAGLIYLAHAFGARSWGGFAWEIILGLVYLAAGVILYAKPLEGVIVLTAVIAISLIFDGIVRTAVSIVMRRGPWGWVLASGILSMVLGFAVFALPAGAAILLLGFLVGVNVFASGFAFLMLGINAESTRQAAEPPVGELAERT